MERSSGTIRPIQGSTRSGNVARESGGKATGCCSGDIARESRTREEECSGERESLKARDGTGERVSIKLRIELAKSLILRASEFTGPEEWVNKEGAERGPSSVQSSMLKFKAGDEAGAATARPETEGAEEAPAAEAEGVEMSGRY